MMKASLTARSTLTVWLVLLLLLLVDGFQVKYTVHALAFAGTGPYARAFVACRAKKEQLNDAEDYESSDKGNGNVNPSGINRRGTLMSLLGTAVSFAAGDRVMTAALQSTGAAFTGLYERVLAFGNQYKGAAIASEELTTWIAAQSVAATPEIRAWLAAQKRLQAIRSATLAATAALTCTKTTAAAAGSVLEEGMVTAAVTKMAVEVAKKKDEAANDGGVVGGDTIIDTVDNVTELTTTSLEATTGTRKEKDSLRSRVKATSEENDAQDLPSADSETKQNMD